MTQGPEQPAQHDPDWFRPPSKREHWIAAGLFIGFGVFFITLFFLHRHWGFRWVILGLGIISVYAGLRHWAGARRTNI